MVWLSDKLSELSEVRVFLSEVRRSVRVHGQPKTITANIAAHTEPRSAKVTPAGAGVLGRDDPPLRLPFAPSSQCQVLSLPAV